MLPLLPAVVGSLSPRRLTRAPVPQCPSFTHPLPPPPNRATGVWPIGKRNLMFAADYMLRCHLNASDTPSANVYVAQVGGEGQGGGACAHGWALAATVVMLRLVFSCQ